MTTGPAGSLAGHTAFVSGSGKNIGKAIVLEFARRGANVVVNGHTHRDQVEKVVEQARAMGVKAVAAMADVSDPGQVESAVAAAANAVGAIDIAVSNVGVRLHQPFMSISPPDWDRIIKTNLSSAFYLAHAVLPGMQAKKWGRIIHISGRDGFFVKENRAHNVAAKAGLHALAKAIALGFGPFGITANTVAPGITDTDRDLSQYPDHKAHRARRIPALPARRAGTVAEIAAACAYFASEDAGYVTGALLHVNGGEFMY